MKRHDYTTLKGVVDLHFPGSSFRSHVPDPHSTLLLDEVILARIAIPIRRFVCVAMANPRCFFDITIGGVPTGRIVFEVSTLSPDYRASDSRTYTARFLRQVLSLYTCSLMCYTFGSLVSVDTFFFYLQLRADVVPKTAGVYKALYKYIQKAVANCMWMLVVKISIESIERIC